MASTEQVDDKEEDEGTRNGYEHQHTCCAGMNVCKKERWSERERERERVCVCVLLPQKNVRCIPR